MDMKMHMLLHQTPLLFSPFLWPEWTSAHQCINPDGWCTDGFHFFIPGLTLNSHLPHPRPSVTYQTAHISMSSTDAIPIYHVIISPHPSTFLPTSHWSRYLPNPTYLVAPTSLVVFPADLTTTMKILQGTQNCLLKQYLKSWLVFWSTPIWQYCINLKNQECMQYSQVNIS
jgi:hypothetical protein